MPCSHAEKVVSGLLGTVLKEQRCLPSVSHPAHPSKFSYARKFMRMEYVQADQRDGSVQHLLRLAVHFGFEPETFCLAVRFIDVFLSKIKVHPKYLEVISLSSLVLAAKLSEEDEYIPEIEDFVVVSHSSCTAADVVRMERVMLDKLGWDLLIPTPLTFLEQYCNVLESFGYFKQDQKRSIVSHAVPTLLQLLTDSSFLLHKSSTIALAVLSYELSFFHESVIAPLTDLANYAQIHDSEMMHCRGLLQDFFEKQLLAACKEKRRKKKKRTHSASSSSGMMPTIWESGDEVIDQYGHIVSSKEIDRGDHCEFTGEKDMGLDIKISSYENHVKSEVTDLPNICEKVSKCRRTESDWGGKPLYSTVVKGAVNGMLKEGQFLVTASLSNAVRSF